MMKRTALALAIASLPTTAFAYVGPGAGLSLLGALWALIAAVGLAFAFVVAWPIRKMLRRRRALAQSEATASEDSPASIRSASSKVASES